MIKRKVVLGCVTGFGVILSLVACGAESEFDSVGADITGNVSNPGAVTTEWMRPNAGRYKSVMQADSCTGTVVGPHAVLTAYHCAKPLANDLSYDGPCNVIGPGSNKRITWRKNPGNNADDTVFTVTNNYGNPHAVNRKYYLSRRLPVPEHAAGQSCEYRPYRANFWGNQTMMPHPNDVAVFFVPGLTQEFIDNNRIPVEKVDGIAFDRALKDNAPVWANGIRVDRVWFDYEIVGRMGGDNRRRRYGQAIFGAPNAADPGQLPLRTNVMGAVHTNPGDSGGPTFGYLNRWFEPNPRRVVMATTKSGLASPSVTTAASNPVNTVPIAYIAGMSSEQREAVRLNHLWLQARIDDADNDGYPIQCDSDPSSPGPDRTARCPAPDGRPIRSKTKGYPQGSLMCDDGFVATGYYGKYSDWGIRRLGLQCRPVGCVDGSDGASCTRSYRTDQYGLSNSGTSFSQQCRAGLAIYGFHGRITDSNGRIQSLGIKCKKPGRYATYHARGRTGTDRSRQFTHDCSNNRLLQGVVARMMSRYHISGIQGVCTN